MRSNPSIRFRGFNRFSFLVCVFALSSMQGLGQQPAVGPGHAPSDVSPASGARSAPSAHQGSQLVTPTDDFARFRIRFAGTPDQKGLGDCSVTFFDTTDMKTSLSSLGENVCLGLTANHCFRGITSVIGDAFIGGKKDISNDVCRGSSSVGIKAPIDISFGDKQVREALVIRDANLGSTLDGLGVIAVPCPTTPGSVKKFQLTDGSLGNPKRMDLAYPMSLSQRLVGKLYNNITRPDQYPEGTTVSQGKTVPLYRQTVMGHGVVNFTEAPKSTNGDSGSPAFVTEGGKRILAGVLSGQGEPGVSLLAPANLKAAVEQLFSGLNCNMPLQSSPQNKNDGVQTATDSPSQGSAGPKPFVDFKPGETPAQRRERGVATQTEPSSGASATPSAVQQTPATVGNGCPDGRCGVGPSQGGSVAGGEQSDSGVLQSSPNEMIDRRPSASGSPQEGNPLQALEDSVRQAISNPVLRGDRAGDLKGDFAHNMNILNNGQNLDDETLKKFLKQGPYGDSKPDYRQLIDGMNREQLLKAVLKFLDGAGPHNHCPSCNLGAGGRIDAEVLATSPSQNSSSGAEPTVEKDRSNGGTGFQIVGADRKLGLRHERDKGPGKNIHLVAGADGKRYAATQYTRTDGKTGYSSLTRRENEALREYYLEKAEDLKKLPPEQQQYIKEFLASFPDSPKEVAEAKPEPKAEKIQISDQQLSDALGQAGVSEVGTLKEDKSKSESEYNSGGQHVFWMTDDLTGNSYRFVYDETSKKLVHKPLLGEKKAEYGEPKNAPKEAEPDREVKLGDLSKMTSTQLLTLRRQLDRIYFPGEAAQGIEQLNRVTEELRRRQIPNIQEAKRKALELEAIRLRARSRTSDL